MHSDKITSSNSSNFFNSNHNAKLVSIVLPTYNGEKYIRQSLDSILSQTYTNFELILVDDCSTDTTPAIILEYEQKDSRIKSIRSETNKKLPTSLNIGFAISQGEYFTWTSDDNYYLPNAIQTMVNYLESNTDYGMVCAKVALIGHSGRDFGCTKPITPVELLNVNLCESCFLYRKSVAKTVGEYDVNMLLLEDYDYWLRVLLHTPIGHIDEVLYYYRYHEKSLTHRFRNEVKQQYIKLILRYSEPYALNFPEFDEPIKAKLAIYESVLEHDTQKFDTALKVLSKRKIYEDLVYLYKALSDFYIIKLILKLKGVYYFKALNIWRKALFSRGDNA